MKKNKPTSQPSIQEKQQLLNLYNQGLFVEAIASAEALIARFPEDGFCWKVLGVLLDKLGRPSKNAKQKAVALMPNDSEVHNNLGEYFKKQKNWKEAEKSYLRALGINPNFTIALCNLGYVLKNQAKFREAEQHYLKALELNPNFSEAYADLGYVFMSQQKFKDAQKVFEKALKIAPTNGFFLDGVVSTRQKLCDWKVDENAQIMACLENLQSVAMLPFCLLAIQNFNSKFLRYSGKLFADFTYKLQLNSVPFTTKIPHSHKKLRIGYLSADFHSHATVYLMAGVLENRNTENFDVYLYSYGGDAKDDYRSRVEKACDVFRNIRQLSDDVAAQQIVADEIDILVDLKGYTAGSRLGIQALRPAPIVVSWLGYPATLGHERLADYIVGDATVTPLEHAEHFSETLALMPHCYQPNDNTRPIGACPTRADAGLPEKGFVFATFNQAYKITPEMFTVWCRLLAAVPNSVLWILEPHEVAQENLRREMIARGVDSSRLIFAPKMEQTEHLGRLQLVDLAVDTFPYTSHTTASDALWAGVPLVTKMGETFASRVAASILRTMDLAELVTTNDDDYFNMALNLAKNPEKLAAIKQKISTQKNTSPLFDTQKFAFDLERLYQTIWAQELKGERKAVFLESTAKLEFHP